MRNALLILVLGLFIFACGGESASTNATSETVSSSAKKEESPKEVVQEIKLNRIPLMNHLM